ncbi:MAG: hypothetical protein WB986_10415, partial [Methanoregula sp.]|uniref:hypothetical protein n=1 Tax=Methanoregula sp. TaxID=2052170 RepID=UPI003C60195E
MVTYIIKDPHGSTSKPVQAGRGATIIVRWGQQVILHNTKDPFMIRSHDVIPPAAQPLIRRAGPADVDA